MISPLWRPEFMKPGMHQGWLTRVALAGPPGVKSYPYNDHSCSEVAACIFLEQINPPNAYAVPCKDILAIHKAVG